MKKEPNELDILLPEQDTVINGERIEVRPFHFSKLPKVIGLLSQMGAAIYQMLSHDGLEFKESGSPVMNEAFLLGIEPILTEHFPAVVSLISCYTNKDESFYMDEGNGFDYENGLLLISKIIERNYSFFTKRLAPTMEKIISGIKEKAKK
jgi:hypothetical protein